MSADEYTPTTGEIRGGFIRGACFSVTEASWQRMLNPWNRDEDMDSQVDRLVGEAFDRWLTQHETAIRRDQIEKDAAIAERTFPLGSLVLGDAPAKIATLIRAQSSSPREVADDGAWEY